MDLKSASNNARPPQAPLVEPASPKPVLTEDPFKPDAPVGKSPKSRQSRGMLKKLVTLLVALALLGGTGYGVYYWQHQQVDKLAKQAQGLTKYVSDLQVQVTGLTKDVADAKAGTPTTTGTTVIKVTELGVQFAVDNSIKDLTYKVSTGTLSDGTKITTATLTTARLFAKDSACSTTRGPLGSVSKTTGQYPVAATKDNSTGALVRQFTDFYISYAASQSACSADTATRDLQLSQHKLLIAALNPLATSLDQIK